MKISGDESFSNSVWGVDVDDDNNIYVTGRFGGEVDFDPLGSGPRIESGGCHTCGVFGTNMFLAKYSTDGILDWVVNAKSELDDIDLLNNSGAQGWDVKTYGDTTYITGNLLKGSYNFNPRGTSPIILSTENGDFNSYGFLAKYNNSNGHAEWAHSFAQGGKLFGLGVDPNGNVAIAGYFFRPCLLYTSPSPRDQRGSRMPSSA